MDLLAQLGLLDTQSFEQVDREVRQWAGSHGFDVNTVSVRSGTVTVTADPVAVSLLRIDRDQLLMRLRQAGCSQVRSVRVWVKL